MKLENQVCSLEFAKRLKELGVKQESYFWWSNKTSDDKWKVENRDFYAIDRRCDVSAFTVAELGKMLPEFILKDGFSFDLRIIRSSVWRLYYGPESHDASVKFTAGSNDSEADARAKMLVYLLENKLINPAL